MAAGEHVIGCETRTELELVAQAIYRHHETLPSHQCRRIARQPPALQQGLMDQADTTLGKIADSAVHQLGRARELVPFAKSWASSSAVR